jgi:MoaA/NifB/PqqE/SkfB family radical SAM enzyme
MPAAGLAARAVVAFHLGRKALSAAAERPLPAVMRAAVAEAAFFEIARRNFGWGSMIRGGNGFFPHIFMPDYAGPQFDEAMRRLVFPRRGPNILYFSLTGACPCHCEYCFAGAGGSAPPDLGDQAAVEVARAVAALRVPLVNLSGGEPLARYDRLLAVVRVLREASEVRMFTTGIGLTAPRLAELRDAGLKGVFVSLDGPDAEAFDRARQRPGAFAAAVDALRLCARAGMLTFVNTVVGAGRFGTAAEVDAFLAFVEGIDPRIVVNFLPMLATGRGASADSFGAPEQCDAVARRIVDAADARGRPVSMLFGRIDAFIGCPGAGGKLMNIDIEGNVTVCISRASLGNLLREPFPSIYARFVERCDRLKVGFFCCEVSTDGHGELLDVAESGRALERFHAGHVDAEWQTFVDRYGGLLARVLAE